MRRAFTLVELLVVIAIILLLAGITLAIYNTNRSSDRMRSAARVAQSAILGAKDRALHAKDFRGVRLTRESTAIANGPFFANGLPCLASGFAYVQPLPMLTSKGITVTRPNYPASSEALQIVIPAADAAAWNLADSQGLFPSGTTQVRIPATTGPWYQINAVNTTAPYWGVLQANGTLILNFATIIQKVGQPPSSVFTAGKPPVGPTFNAVDPNDVNASIDIRLGNEIMPFHQPMPLTAGCVIDLRYSSSNAQYMAGATAPAGSSPPDVEFVFSPRGDIVGFPGGSGAIYFCLRSIEDAVGPGTSGTTPRDPSDPACKGDCLILALNPQTGLVQTYNADLTDGNADGYADNLFRFAQQGKAAGR